MPTPIKLDKNRHLHYSFYGIRRLKKEHGINMLELGDSSMLDPEIVVGLVWAGLVHEDHDLTMDAVAEMIDFGNMRYVTDKFGEEYANAQAGDMPPDPTQAPAG